MPGYLDSPDSFPFPFPNEVDGPGHLTSRSSSDDNNIEILGHQFFGTPLLSGGIPAFASAASSPGIPWELLVAARNAGFDTASTVAQQTPFPAPRHPSSPNHEVFTYSPHSDPLNPIDAGQGTKPHRSTGICMPQSVKPGTGSYKLPSRTRRKKVNMRKGAAILSDAPGAGPIDLADVGQDVGPHRSARRSRTSKRDFAHELADDASDADAAAGAADAAPKPTNTYKASRFQCPHLECPKVSRPDAISRHRYCGACRWTDRDFREACEREGCTQRPLHTCLALRQKKGPHALPS